MNRTIDLMLVKVARNFDNIECIGNADWHIAPIVQESKMALLAARRAHSLLQVSLSLEVEPNGCHGGSTF